MSTNKRPKSEKLVFERKLLKSKAYLSLSATAIKVLNFFHMKKIMVKIGGKWNIANNGEIVFTYDEAVKIGFSKRSFRDALDKLISTGFIEVAHTGGGLDGNYSKYSIVEHWKKYGTDDFKIKPREKDTRKIGFKKGHSLQPRKKGSKLDQGNTSVTGPVTEMLQHTDLN